MMAYDGNAEKAEIGRQAAAAKTAKETADAELVKANEGLAAAQKHMEDNNWKAAQNAKYLALSAEDQGKMDMQLAIAEALVPSQQEQVETATAAADEAATVLASADKYVNELEEIVRPYGGSVEAVVANIGQRRGFGAGDSGGTTTHISHVVVPFPDWLMHMWQVVLPSPVFPCQFQETPS